MKTAVWTVLLGCALATVSVPITTIQPRASEWYQLQLGRTRNSARQTGRPVELPTTYHLVNMTIGFPPKQFQVEVDVTMSGFWVTSETCESLGCAKKEGYNSADSMMHKASGESVRVDIPGGRGHGKRSSDTVSIAGLHVVAFSFSELDRVGGTGMLRSPYDGVMGIQWSESDTNPENLVSALFTRGLIESNSFSTSFSRTNGDQLVLGGAYPNQGLFSFEYYPLLPLAPWTIHLNSLEIAQTALNLTSPSLQIDLKVPYFAGSMALTESINSAIGPISSNCTNIDTLPSVWLKLGLNEYEIRPENYVIRAELEEETTCYSGFVGVKPGDGMEETLVLGDAFARLFNVHFDLGNKQLGFGLSA